MTGPGPEPPVKYAWSLRRSIAEAVGRGIMQQNPWRMSLMRDKADFRYSLNEGLFP